MGVVFGEQVGVVSIFSFILVWLCKTRWEGGGVVGMNGQAESKFSLPSGIDGGTVLLVSDRDVHLF